MDSELEVHGVEMSVPPVEPMTRALADPPPREGPPETSVDGSSIRGIVLDPDGAPVPEVQIECSSDALGRRWTDLEGRFTLPLVPPTGGEGLVFSAPSYAPTLATAFPGRFLTVHLRRGVLVSGQLLLEGTGGRRTPLAHCRMPYGFWKGHASEIRTDENGNFQFIAEPNSEEQVTVDISGQAEWREVIPVGEVALVHDIVVPPASVTLRLFVTDERTGSPMVDAEIASRNPRRRSGEPAFPLGRTSHEGSLDLVLRPGIDSEISAVAPGYTMRSQQIKAPLPGSRLSANLEMVRSGEIFGTVVDHLGRPVAGAEVMLTIERLRLTVPTHLGVKGVESGATATTDEVGAFRFGGVGNEHPMLYATLRARHPRFGRADSDRLPVYTSASVGPVRIELPSAAAIAGTVRANGRGARATLAIAEERGTELHTDDSDRYHFEGVPPGEWTVVARLEEFPQIFRRYPVSIAAGTELVLDIELDLTLEAIHGVVRSVDGTAVPSAPLECEVPTEWGRVIYRSRTTDTGSYEFDVPRSIGAGSSEYTLRLTRWMGDYEQRGIVPPAMIDIPTNPSTTVSLLPMDADSKEPIDKPWFDVEWHPGQLGENELTLYSCMSRLQRNDGLIEVIVPAGKGWMTLHRCGYENEVRALPETGRTLGIIEMHVSAPE